MFYKNLVVLIILSAFVFPSFASAGLTTDQEVRGASSRYYRTASGYSYYVPGYFSGSLSAARYSSDNTQYIGCNVSSQGTGRCYAKTRNGRSYSCTTNTSKLVATIGNLTESSHIYVSFRSGKCVSLRVSTDSHNLE